MQLDDILTSRARLKIIKLLILYREINITRLIRETGLNHAVVKRHLAVLLEAGIAEEETQGRLRIIRLREDNPLVRRLRELLLEAEDAFQKTRGQSYGRDTRA